MADPSDWAGAEFAGLPAAEQVEEVRKELVRRDPGFDGTVEHKIEGGVVTELRVNTDTITDIAPIRVFNTLQMLDLSGTKVGDAGLGAWLNEQFDSMHGRAKRRR